MFSNKNTYSNDFGQTLLPIISTTSSMDSLRPVKTWSGSDAEKLDSPTENQIFFPRFSLVLKFQVRWFMY